MKYKKQCLKSLIYTIILIATIISISFAGNEKKLHLSGRIQINQDTGIVPVLASDEDMVKLLNLSGYALFLNSYMVGEFCISNITNDTLILCPDGQALLDFVVLKYSFPEDSLTAPKSIPINTAEMKSNYNGIRLPSWGDGNVLPPKASAMVDISCSWDEISKIDHRVVDFFLSYDNSAMVAEDSSITEAKYSSRIKRIRIVKVPENRADSLFHYGLQAKRMNGGERFEEALEFSRRLLEMDSTNYIGLETAADVLWKMGRFDEAIVYARKGKELLEYAATTNRENQIVTGYDQAGRFIERMQFFIDKCQRREKWKWAK